MTSAAGRVDELRRRLRDALGAEVVLDDPTARRAAGSDRSRWAPGGTPAFVVRATDEAHVVATLAAASASGVPVVPRGAGTGLSGGAAPIDGGIVLDLSGMDRVVELDPAARTAVVQPGVITAVLDRRAAEHGLAFAPDPASAEISTIGGNIATGAGGLRCVKYGTTRDAVLRLRVVLASGEILELGAGTRKDVAGLDLLGLFVGSEGALGVVVEATVRLIPRPTGPRMLVATCAGWSEVEAAVLALDRAPVTPSLVELLDRGALRRRPPERRAALGIHGDPFAVLLVEADGPGAEDARDDYAQRLRGAGAVDLLMLDDAGRDAALAFRRGDVRPGADAQIVEDPDEWWLGEDMTVPPARLAGYLVAAQDIAARHGVGLSLIAHVADGNLHPSLTLPRAEADESQAGARLFAAADELVRLAIASGGSITGEHGIGTLKRAWLGDALGPRVLELQRAVKAVFDPHGVLNPGRGL